MSKALQVTKMSKMAAKIKARHQRAVEAMSRFDRVALFDGSGSMGTADAHDRNGLPCTRWDALKSVWPDIAHLAAGRLAAFVFSGSVSPVKGAASGKALDLTYQGADTRMCAALRQAGTFKHPRMRVLLVSDGEPTDGDPVPIAAVLGCPVDAVFVGAADSPGKDTLRKIAEATGGLFLDMAGKFDASRFLEHCKTVLQLEAR